MDVLLRVDKPAGQSHLGCSSGHWTVFRAIGQYLYFCTSKTSKSRTPGVLFGPLDTSSTTACPRVLMASTAMSFLIISPSTLRVCSLRFDAHRCIGGHSLRLAPSFFSTGASVFGTRTLEVRFRGDTGDSPCPPPVPPSPALHHSAREDVRRALCFIGSQICALGLLLR